MVIKVNFPDQSSTKINVKPDMKIADLLTTVTKKRMLAESDHFLRLPYAEAPCDVNILSLSLSFILLSIFFKYFLFFFLFHILFYFIVLTDMFDLLRHMTMEQVDAQELTLSNKCKCPLLPLFPPLTLLSPSSHPLLSPSSHPPLPLTYPIPSLSTYS